MTDLETQIHKLLPAADERGITLQALVSLSGAKPSHVRQAVNALRTGGYAEMVGIKRGSRYRLTSSADSPAGIAGPTSTSI